MNTFISVDSKETYIAPKLCKSWPSYGKGMDRREVKRTRTSGP
jgi:hypothetical protein